MLKPPWGINAAHSRLSEDDSGADLQVDVMRFMAILAFCLLAVFALMQSVPNSAQDQLMRQALPIAPERLKAEAPMPPSAKPTNQARTTTSTQILQEIKTIPGAQPQDMRPEASDTVRSMETEKNAFPNDIKERQPQQQSPKGASSSADARAPTTTDAQSSVRTAHDNKGFALRFESDLALESLVAKGRVQLFGQVGKRIWLLSIKSGHLRFHPTTAPGQFHVMTPGSVPVRIATALRRDAAITHPERVAWGVTLPRATTDQIMRHLRQSSGGSLLIQADGRVRLQDAR